MKIEFNKLNDQTKIWVYTSESKINDVQKEQILRLSDHFLSDWESHGKNVPGVVEVIESHFVVIAADGQGDTLCGRAVDANVRFIKKIQDITGLKLMDRTIVAYKQNGELFTTDFNRLKQEINLGKLAAETTIFNPMVSTIKEFKKSFEQSVKNNWID